MSACFPHNPDISTANLLTDLDRQNFALLPGLLSAEQCESLAALFAAGGGTFRNTIDMERFGFGSGQYRYFAYPLPPLVATLREALYPYLAPIANTWSERLGIKRRWPEQLDDLLDLCRSYGQSRPTPLLLRYEPGDFNNLHQDLYGDIHFPLQVVVQLSRPGIDFIGGEFVLVENRPRTQARARVVPLLQGDAAVFPVRECPSPGKRGWRRSTLRHGVSEVTEGCRQTLGLIFHDAS